MDEVDPAVEVVPETTARSQVSTSALTYGTNLGVAFLSLVSVLIVSRALGPSGRGSVAFLTAISVLTHYASTLGVQEANVNIAGVDQSARRALATNSILLAILFGGTAAVTLGAISSRFPAATGHARPELVWLVLASVPVQLIATYLSRLVQADYRFGLSNAAWIAAPAAIVAVNSLLLAIGRLSVTSAVAAWVAGQTLCALILIGAVMRSPGFGLPRVDLAVRAVRFGIKVHPATVMSFTNYRLDQWLLGVLATRRELGLYSVAVSWSEALFFLPTAVSYAQRPHLVRGSAVNATRNAAQAFRAATITTVPLAVGLILAAPLLCTTVFGERFSGSVVDLRILTLGAFGIVAIKLLGNALTARGRPFLQTAGTSVAFVFTVALDLLLIPSYGGPGAAVASAVAYTAGGVAMASIFVRKLNCPRDELIPRLGDLGPTAQWIRHPRGTQAPEH
jgi:O-antigen/teichoic acid export membrane protein